MKDEIKEILDRLENNKGTYYVGYVDGINIDNELMPKDIDKLLDCITNLQNTNKNHSKKLIELGDKITNLQEENRQTKLLKERYQLEKEVYKSRNEKANEFIKEHTNNFAEYLDVYEAKELSNILQGEDKDEQ